VADNSTPPADTNPATPPEPEKNPPAKPPETEKAKAPEPEKNPPAKPPEPEKAPPAKPPEPPPIPKPRTERKEIGRFASRDKALVRRDREGEPWVRVAPDGRVSTVAALVSLPGFASELRLDSGAILTLWGNLPDAGFSPVLDTK